MSETEKQVIIYQIEDGKEPFTRWRKGLGDKMIVAQLDRRLDLVRAGHCGDYKPVGEGVYELRDDPAQAYAYPQAALKEFD